MSRHAILDGDVLVYQSGFASDSTAKKATDGQATHEPLANQLHITKQLIQRILDRAKATSYSVVVSHPVNYREQFFPEYKLNRNILHKPFWYSEIQQYLFDTHDAIYSLEGDEADDYMGILQMEHMMEDKESIICTIDKDLDMIPGLHYNFSKTKEANGVYEIQDPYGLQLFYKQILTGDSSDNIPGMYKKLGIKAEQKWMMPLETMTNARQMYDYVLEVYQGDKAHVDLMAKILWIKRDNRWWEAPQ